MEVQEQQIEEQSAIVPEAPKAIDPIEEAAMKFTQLLPFVKKLSQAMNAKGLARVNHAMAEFPLGKDKPHLLNNSERQLFQIMQELNGYKSTVISDIIKKQQAMAQAEKKEEVNESSENQI